MSTAIKTVLSDFEPNSLQKAAIRLIKKLNGKLAEKGLQLRAAMELEFTVVDENGIPQPNTLNLAKAQQYIQNLRDEGLPHLQEFKIEGVEGAPKPELAKQYEVTIDDTKGYAALKQGKAGFRPEQVAAITLYMKKECLPDMLKNTSCLYTDNYRTKKLHASFAPNPYTSLPAEMRDSIQPTNALHINTSLIDNSGRNILGHSKNLTMLCADSLRKIQNEATLAFLPSTQSLERINANNCAPGGIGIAAGKCFMGNRHTSVCIRGFFANEKDYDGSSLRIENRLCGADVDPFVALAVTMAAMVDTIQKIRFTKSPDNKMSMVIPSFLNNAQDKYEIPKTHEAIVERFKAAQHLKELLGAELYTEILNNTKPAITRAN